MSENSIVKILKSAPLVTCPVCEVTMTLRHLDPVPSPGQARYTAGYRCPVCGTDTDREFTIVSTP
jgi:hypothetical protein